MDGALPLLLAWQMEAKEMAKITKEEWAKGTANLKCVCIFSVRYYPIADDALKDCISWCSLDSPQRSGEALGFGRNAFEEIDQT